MNRVAIIGSGPTGIYTLKGLLALSAGPLAITIFEREADAGKGTPYHPHINDQAMLANIASIELPPVVETLEAWLQRQSDAELERLNVARAAIAPREFYPRIVLGEFFQDQFRQLIAAGEARGHQITVRPNHRVRDIAPQPGDIRLDVEAAGAQTSWSFDHVVMATGHDWPDTTEVRPGYFMSPWPAPVLKTIAPGHVGILGTSLSAIDALVSVATAHGAFYFDAEGQLQYRAAAGHEGFRATLMSRKGILPEADFYCDYPYRPLAICTPEAVDALAARGSAGLLDAVFELFQQELAAADPDYAARIGLSLLTVETLSGAYFAAREAADPFVWTATNLAEAQHNKAQRITVPWRYAILRMHEVIARAVPFLDADDLRRFHKSFKSVFIDDYATVPHQSLQRLLALRRAGRLDILRLGARYDIATEGVATGAAVRHNGTEVRFDAFIDATGQTAMSARDIPFPSLVAAGIFRKATTPEGGLIVDGEGDEPVVRTGGVDLDDAFRPRGPGEHRHEIYCAAISFLLHKMPFVQGITSANEIGAIVAKSITGRIAAAQGAADLVA
jgi:uncharacterized NAD(P)/FAD-binding protein YdhS